MIGDLVTGGVGKGALWEVWRTACLRLSLSERHGNMGAFGPFTTLSQLLENSTRSSIEVKGTVRRLRRSGKGDMTSWGNDKRNKWLGGQKWRKEFLLICNCPPD